MSASLYKIQYTTAGIASLLDEKNRGVKAEITHIALGSGAYTPTGFETELQSEQQRVAIASHERDGEVLYLSAAFEGEQEYDIREAGIFLADGTLLGVTSHPHSHIDYKTSGNVHIQRLAIVITLLPTDSFEVAVGASNLNLIMINPFAKLACAQINNMTRHLKQKFKLMELNLI